MMKFEFRNEAESAEIKIYDYIDSDGWGISANYIDEQLQALDGKPLNILINSNGGDVFEGFAIYNILKRYSGHKTVIVDGLAASIASVIAMAGDKVVMNKASMLMIHNASSAVWGNAEEMKKVVQALESINEVIRSVYLDRVNITEDKLTELMDNETFISAKDCVEMGFADEISDKEQSDETITNARASLESMVKDIENKTKLFKDLNKALEVGGRDSVGGQPFLNSKKAKYSWLKMEE